MKFQIRDGLPFVTIQLTYREHMLDLDAVLLDTGSASTLLAVDELRAIGLDYELSDELHRVLGVGGGEFVFAKRVERLQVGNLSLADFEIEVGAMEYGFEVKGIIGADFFAATGAVIDFANMEIR